MAQLSYVNMVGKTSKELLILFFIMTVLSLAQGVVPEAATRGVL